MVRADGGDPAAVETRTVGFTLGPALAAGKVNAVIGAYWNIELVELERQGVPARAFRLEENGVPDYDELVVVTSEEIARDRPELVEAFLRGLRAGQDWAATDEAGAVEHLVAANEDLDPDVVKDQLDMTAELLSPPDEPTLNVNPAEWAAFAAWMHDNGLLERAGQRRAGRHRPLPAGGAVVSDDLLVIGAGPWGLATGWLAARRGARVTVLDDGRPPAARVAAGMLGHLSEAADDDEALDALLARAAEAWPSMADGLARAAGRDPGFRRSGAVLAASRPEHVAILRRRLETISRRGRPAEWLPASALRALEPGLGPDVAGGADLPEEHQAEPRALLAALRAACASAGARVVAGEERSDTTVTAEAVHLLLEEALHVAPGLGELELAEARAGLRPTTPDGLPAIGEDPESGMVWAVGGHRHGILLTPLAAEAAVAAAAGEPTPGWARSLSPARFAGVAVA